MNKISLNQVQIQLAIVATCSEVERCSNIYQNLVAGEKECMDIERPQSLELEAILYVSSG